MFGLRLSLYIYGFRFHCIYGLRLSLYVWFMVVYGGKRGGNLHLALCCRGDVIREAERTCAESISSIFDKLLIY